MQILKRITDKIIDQYRYGYLYLTIVGLYRYFYLGRLQSRFNFDPWHRSPKELRPYTMDMISYLNSQIGIKDTVVEVGCGIGEIVNNLRCDNLYGYDMSREVVEAARYLDKKKRVHYDVGTFEDIVGLNIDFFIAVNFVQDIDPATLKEAFRHICENNSVRNIVVDTFGIEKKYNHDYASVLPENYKLFYRSRSYRFEQEILIFENSTFSSK